MIPNSAKASPRPTPRVNGSNPAYADFRRIIHKILRLPASLKLKYPRRRHQLLASRTPAHKKPPGHRRAPARAGDEVDHLVRRASNLSIRKYAHRFHLNSLIARYNAMSELWGKTMRAREEGDRPPAQLADRRGARATSCRIGENDRDDLALRRLHREFEEARKRSVTLAGFSMTPGTRHHVLILSGDILRESRCVGERKNRSSQNKSHWSSSQGRCPRVYAR